MRIRNNLDALRNHQSLAATELRLTKGLERLSTGLRVNRASDDAAGLAISEKLRGQVNGSYQALKNAQDGISLAQLGEGSLGEVHGMLQRMRSLAVQASNSGTLSSDQKQAMQDEFSQLRTEIDNISTNTAFNGIKLLQGGSVFTDAQIQAVLNAIQNSLLADAYAVVKSRFSALTVDPANSNTLSIYMDDLGPSAFSAYVSAAGGPFSPPTLELHVNLYVFVNGGGLGTPPFFNDRILAHELVHAAIFNETNYFGIPTWFNEGAAEFVHGADERVSGILGAMGGDNPINRQALINTLGPGVWSGTNQDYAAAVLAVRYLHDQIPGGINAAFALLDDNPAGNINAVLALAGYANEAAFFTDFQTNGLAWMAANTNLADADTGSIAGSDYGGPSLDEDATVPNGTPGDPTEFVEVYVPRNSGSVQIQVGADEGEQMTITLANATTASLGLDTLDLTVDAEAAITAIDDAIVKVSRDRGIFGASINRLEHDIGSLFSQVEQESASYSRIRDADMAETITEQTRSQVIFSSATAMAAQANAKPTALLGLLLG